MFCGLIEATGRIERIDVMPEGRRLRVATPLGAELRPGDSVSTSGVCLTVIAADAQGFAADVSPETARVTSLGDSAVGRAVNLERPLPADGRIGGHFVLGHVDGVGRVHALGSDGGHRWLEVDAPAALAPLLISKGSIAVDGVSLTVASLSGPRFGVQIVPFTWAHTALAELSAGDPVNLEADVLGKYVARLLEMQGVKL
jgi:riboflavin synthase